MDILTLIILFLLAQNIPILHEFLLIIGVFGVLALFWISIVLFITIGTTVIALLVLPPIYKSTFRLGIYHTLIQKSTCEYHSKKLKAVLRENLVVGIFLFLALIYIFNSVPSSFFANESCGAINVTPNQTVSAASQNSIPRPVPDVAFASTLIIIPTFLLSLRLLANPTEDWMYKIINCQNLTPTEKRDKIRYFKDQVTSFFYSFVAGTLILVYLSFIFTVSMIKINNLNDYYRAICPFIPKMDIYSIIFFSILEIVIVILTTLIGEWFLKNSPPIDQMPISQIPPIDYI